MKIAVISDVHGNIDALDSVLKDIEDNRADIILSTGDMVGYLPYPNEVVERMQNERILSIQGNHDLVIAGGEALTADMMEGMTTVELQSGGSRIYTNNTISDMNRRYLSELPKTLTLTFGEMAVKLVHGSPERIDEYMYDDTDALQEAAAALDADVLIMGHTHKAYHRMIDGKHFINAGSAGKPKHGNPNGSYVMLEFEGNALSAEIREVAYDYDRLCEAIRREPLISNALIEAIVEGK